LAAQHGTSVVATYRRASVGKTEPALRLCQKKSSMNERTKPAIIAADTIECTDMKHKRQDSLHHNVVMMMSQPE
jgi:hypothetical protein